MHNNSYSVNVACLVSENFTNSLKEVKSFFTFKLNVIDKEQESAIKVMDQPNLLPIITHLKGDRRIEERSLRSFLKNEHLIKHV